MATATYTQLLQTDGADSGDVGDAISHVAVHVSNSVDDCIATFDLTAMLAGIAAGQPVQFQPNVLIFTLLGTPTDATWDRITPLGVLEAIKGIFAADRYLTWHTGDPGANGTSNRVAGIDPTLLDVSNLTFAQ